MFQNITIVGRLGKEPEMRYTPEGKPVTNFSVAVSKKRRGTEKTWWFRVTAWDKQAEACNNYLKKGSLVLVEGELVCSDEGNPRTYNRQDGTVGTSFEISASQVTFLTWENDEEEEPANGNPFF